MLLNDHVRLPGQDDKVKGWMVEAILHQATLEHPAPSSSHVIKATVSLQVADSFWTTRSLRSTSTRRQRIKRKIQAYSHPQTQKPNMVQEILHRPPYVQVIADRPTDIAPEKACRFDSNCLQGCLLISTFCTPGCHDPVGK